MSRKSPKHNRTPSSVQDNTPLSESPLEIKTVMPGADVVQLDGRCLALGFPEEVVKAWKRAGIKPCAWIMPDVRSADGIVQWAVETPLRYALAEPAATDTGALAGGNRLPVLLRKEAWPALEEYLRLSLLGPSHREMERAGVPAQILRMLSVETRHLSLKKSSGERVGIDDLLEPIFFDNEGVAQVLGLRIRAHGDNTFSFFTASDRIEEYHLDCTPAAVPPYSHRLEPASSPVVPERFEVTMLGTGNGLETDGPCTSMVVQASGRFVLVDTGPYLQATLAHAGLSLQQIDVLVLTHAHEEQSAGISALLTLRHRPRLFTTRETAHVLRRKLAILNPGLDSPKRLLDDAFEVVYVEPGNDYDLLGLTMRFHYTLHAVPCIGVEFSMWDRGRRRSVLVIGDHLSWSGIEEAAANEVITAERLEMLRSLHEWRGDLVVANGGDAPLEEVARDYSSAADCLVFTNTRAPRNGRQHRYSLAEPVNRYTLVSDRSRPNALERGMAERALSEVFAPPDMDWHNALLDAALAENINRNHVFVQEQEESGDLFVLLTGELEVVKAASGGEMAGSETAAGETAGGEAAAGGGKAADEARGDEVGNGAGGTLEVAHGTAVAERLYKVAELHPGDVFGEMAALGDGRRCASVIARAPSRVLRIPGTLYAAFARETNLAARLPDVWEKRARLERAGVLAQASVTVKNRLARAAVRRSIEPGATLIREGSHSETVFVLAEGRVQVYRGTEPLLVAGAPVIVGPGNLIGETAPFLRKARNASIVTLDECEVLALRGADFKRIVEGSPQLFCAISSLVCARRAAA